MRGLPLVSGHEHLQMFPGSDRRAESTAERGTHAQHQRRAGLPDPKLGCQ